MNKKIKKIITTTLMVGASLSMISCNNEKLAIGKEMIAYDTQLTALTNLKNGSVDAVIIDSVMAGYYATTGDFKNEIKVINDVVLAEETYGIAAKKGNKALMSKINEALIDLNNNGSLTTIATQFGLNETLAVTSTSTDTYLGANDMSFENVVSNKKLIIGYTVFAPIAFEKENELTGFDIELAKEVVSYINIKYNAEIDVEFQIINWDSKEALLENGSIDLVWNGMTITEERQENMCISIPYLYNKQVAVVLNSDTTDYISVDSFKNCIIGVESGSAGETVVKG